MQRLIQWSNILFGCDLFCLGKKFLVSNLISRNLKIKYRRSILGYFWTILSPLAMACIYYFVFKIVMRIERPHYISFILSGILPWMFFSQTLSEGVESLVGHQGLISKIPMPLHVFNYVSSLTNLITLTLALPIIFISAYLSGVSLGVNSLWILFFIALLFLFAYTSSFVLAVFYVYLRDLKHAVGLVLQVWFYATPIFYDKTMIPEKYNWLIYLNPLSGIFSGIHEALFINQVPSFFNMIHSLCFVILSIIVFSITYRYFKSGITERL